MDEYDFKTIEPKWQEYWLKEKLFAAKDGVQGKKMYVLDMFPYPSGEGLHVGHVKIYTATDVVARYLRMKGYNVLHPTGWDAFGLPTENSAIKYGMHPVDLTKRNVDRFRKQMQRMGFSYDWDREINTTDPFYYKWTQWIFLKLLGMGLAYQDTVAINWCPSCKTGLANEEVVNGACERCETVVEQKPMKQWMLKITRFAEQLLNGLGGLDWPESIVEQQRNWIGKSEGAEIHFPIEHVGSSFQNEMGSKKEVVVFTTRPDTLYGVTYVVLAPEHELVRALTIPEQKEAVTAYVEQAKQKTSLQRTDLSKTKTGVFTGGHVRNPINGEWVPVWVADYVLPSYGTGAIMAVPAHDARDYEFAQKFGLEIRRVVEPPRVHHEEPQPFTGMGVMVNSGKYSGLSSDEGGRSIVAMLQTFGLARRAVKYKLRDWVFSRQHYWGEPIPVIHCEKCGIVPVPEDQLPVQLPPVEHYEPTGTGESPLVAVEDWVNVKCPQCPAMAKRETDTMPNWAGSSWYFLRFADPLNGDEIASREKLEKWLPVDVYIGGAEHAVLHLLYARFWTKALEMSDIISFSEPFQRFRSVGLVMGEDGQKMSKSRGNVINPDKVVDQYGADQLRLYEMFMGPFDASVAWDTKGIQGASRFVSRFWKAAERVNEDLVSEDLLYELNRTIKRVTEGTEQFKFNTAIAAMMEFLNVLEGMKKIPSAVFKIFVILLAPYAPHLAEELWQRLGNDRSIMLEPWPVFDEAVLARAKIAMPVQINGKVRGLLKIERGVNEEYVKKQALTLPNVARYLAEDEVKKVVFVPDRLINFVLQVSERH